MKTAIFIDGAFFLKRLHTLYKYKTNFDLNNAHDIVEELFSICMKHLNPKQKKSEIGRNIQNPERYDLYRIFFYDCLPVMKKAHLPISKKPIDFSKTPQAKLRIEIHDELKKRRKTALRLGKLQSFGSWAIKKDIFENLLKGKITVAQLQDDDFFYDVRQKNVDMKIGLDIASVAYKKQADQIILISGDSDFVPAAKLARREGIDFILDPMFADISPDLFEHIDGLRSTCYHKKE